MTTADEIAAQLGETGAAPRAQIARIVTRCGDDLANTLLQETLALEGQGGLLTKDGTHRRTPSGVYFDLVRQRVEADDWFFITYGRARGEKINQEGPLAWTDRLAAAHEAQAHSGDVSAVSLLVIGMPKRIAPKEGFVLVTIEQADIPPLPRGLPILPSAATTFLVGVAQSHWQRVERFLKNGEPLIISGYPVPDEKHGRVVMYATRVDTPSTKKMKSKGLARR